MFISPAIAADITLDKITHTITLKGDIVEHDFDNFKKLADSDPDLKTLVISSNGGLFGDGLNIGLYVKEHKLSVDARNFCYSACAFIWLASPEKVLSVDDPNFGPVPYIGIHMPFREDGTTDPDAGAIAGWYLGFLGYSVGAIEDIMTSHYPNMYTISPDSTKTWNLTNVQIHNLVKDNKDDKSKK